MASAVRPWVSAQFARLNVAEGLLSIAVALHVVEVAAQICSAACAGIAVCDGWRVGFTGCRRRRLRWQIFVVGKLLDHDVFVFQCRVQANAVGKAVHADDAIFIAVFDGKPVFSRGEEG